MGRAPFLPNRANIERFNQTDFNAEETFETEAQPILGKATYAQMPDHEKK